MKKVRVLVFPCGSENAAEIHQALRYSLHVEIYGASSVEDCGRFKFEQYIGGLPNIAHKTFDNVFAKLISDLNINMVFATHDTVIEYLAKKSQTMGFFLVNGDETTTAITRKKSLTYNLFSDCTWSPKVFDTIDDIDSWPVVVKPDMGQGGQGVSVVNVKDEIDLVLSKTADPILVEYLPNNEITIDCFTDRNQKLIWIGPRTRERVKAGITMRSKMLSLTDEIEIIAEEINKRLLLRGPWFFQLKGDKNGNWKLLEICSRIAGTMVAQRVRGINLPLMAVQDYLERDLKAICNPHIDLIERNIKTHAILDFEYDTIFVDLDDTLIIDGFATPQVLAFLYQSIKKGKKIKLITRHEFDVKETLQKSCIAVELFDEIIHLRDGTSKAEYVTKNSIFIDNHFPERLDVSSKHAIPVFDVDTLEFFIK